MVTILNYDAPMLSPDAHAHPLALRGVTVRHGHHLALNGINLDLHPGTITALTGPNGAGKSTLLSVLAGIQPHTGTVGPRPRTAYVLQRSALPDRLPVTVRDTVTLGRWARTGLWRPLRRHDTAAVTEALRAVDLTGLAHRPLATLSGGQRQRALVAQGLAAHAGMLLLDEPTAGVDAASRHLILAAIASEAARGALVVHATHDPDAAGCAHQVVELRCGAHTPAY